jgi:3-hydroxyisobutyrate dehydrogenase
MGYGMATNLVKNGYRVKGFDVFPTPVEKFKEAGGIPATSLADSAHESMFYICMVASAPQAQNALFDDPNAIIPALPKGATFLLCSTVPSAYAQSVEQQLQKVGRDDVLMIDAPVSGGAERARDGILTIMAGASPAAIGKGKWLLEEMSDPKKLFIVEGGVGQGSNMKMVHQVLAGIHILGTSEAMGLAARFGLNAESFRTEVLESDAWNWMFQNRSPRILTENYFPGVSALTIILKDVGIITSMARLHKFPTPMSSIAEQVYLSGLARGWGSNDDAGMVRMYVDGPVRKVDPPAKDNDDSTRKTQSIIDMCVAIHVCAAAESIAFAKHVGIPLDQLYDLAVDAAGGSRMFQECGKDMIRGLGGDVQAWTSTTRSSLGDLVRNLTRGIDEAYEVRCPTFLSSGALNLLTIALKQGKPSDSDASVVKLWNV